MLSYKNLRLTTFLLYFNMAAAFNISFKSFVLIPNFVEAYNYVLQNTRVYLLFTNNVDDVLGKQFKESVSQDQQSHTFHRNYSACTTNVVKIIEELNLVTLYRTEAKINKCIKMKVEDQRTH